MNLFAPIVIAASLMLATSAYAQEDQRVADAQAAATAWLALVDAGKFEDSWMDSASLFRTAVPRDNWTYAAGAVRNPLGAVRSRTLKSAQFTRTLQNVPPGEYVVIQYDTDFANKGKLVETITPMREKDGSWKVSGYFVR